MSVRATDFRQVTVCMKLLPDIRKLRYQWLRHHRDRFSYFCQVCTARVVPRGKCVQLVPSHTIDTFSTKAQQNCRFPEACLRRFTTLLLFLLVWKNWSALFKAELRFTEEVGNLRQRLTPHWERMAGHTARQFRAEIGRPFVCEVRGWLAKSGIG